MPPYVPTMRDLVVIGASAGGVEPLMGLVSGLPADLPAPVLVVLHVPAGGTSALPTILDQRSALKVRHARDGDPLRAGEVLFAPADHHLTVVDDRVSLTRGPREKGQRPAVDVLFRSAARARRAGVIAVVLSGALDDGAAGSVAVRQHGGRTIVQSDALFASMPRAANRADDPDAAVPSSEIAGTLTTWLGEPDEHDRPGEPAGFGCPDCAGALFRTEEGGSVRFRCRVGHAWSPDSLVVRQTVDLESALWMALRALEEKAAMNDELAQRAVAAGRHVSAARFLAGAEDAAGSAELVRRLVLQLDRVPLTGEAPHVAAQRFDDQEGPV